jgi:hypothetical protein
MTINANSGLIAWNTTTANVGNQSIVVEVADGRGGTDTQTYTLSVISTPPNRPPIFTTDPVVDAYINQLYTYDANAIDPDHPAPYYFLALAWVQAGEPDEAEKQLLKLQVWMKEKFWIGSIWPICSESKE